MSPEDEATRAAIRFIVDRDSALIADLVASSDSIATDLIVASAVQRYVAVVKTLLDRL